MGERSEIDTRQTVLTGSVVKYREAGRRVGGVRRGILPYISYTGMGCCKGYGFQPVESGIGYRNQSPIGTPPS